MMTELDAILDSTLVTTVFVCGSAAMLYGSAAMLMILLAGASVLGRPSEAPMVLRTRAAS